MHFFRVEDTIKAVQSAGRGRNRERIRVSSMKKMFSKRRLKLADSVRAVLANGLGLLGVTAPEKM